MRSAGSPLNFWFSVVGFDAQEDSSGSTKSSFEETANVRASLHTEHSNMQTVRQQLQTALDTAFDSFKICLKARFVPTCVGT